MNSFKESKKSKTTLKEIQVTSLCPGLKFDAPVYIDENNVFLLEGIPLKQNEIERLHLWDIKAVYTEGNIINDNSGQTLIPHDEVEFDEKIDENKYHGYYRTLIKKYEYVIADIKENITILPERVESIVRDLLSLLTEDNNAMIQLVLGGDKQSSPLVVNAVNCCIISICIGMQLKLLKHRIFELGIAALLHDIGMIRIPEEIYLKKSVLTKKEFDMIKHHLIYSYIIILNELGYHKDLAEYSLFHHENWDGSGYSKHLSGESIPLISRIIAVADTYSAIVGERSYKSRKSGYRAMKIITSHNGKRFDPGIIKAMLESVGFYPIGSIVRLNNSIVGKVVEFSTKSRFRPKIQILNDYHRSGIKKNDIIDLYESKNLFIESIVE